MLSSILFCFLFAGAVGLFTYNIRKIRRNILIGRDVTINDRKGERLKVMARVALGQSKMVTRPVSGIMHILVYIGFILINIEVLEMLIDGAASSHRVFSFMGGFYDFLIGFFEILALGVFIGVIVFWIRRNIVRVRRLNAKELEGFPRFDANAILITEMVLMTALMLMNAADQNLQARGNEHYVLAGSFPISNLFVPALSALSDGQLIFIERFSWWAHMIGILAFLNYLPYSKHLHILLAFPNTYYSNLNAKGRFTTPESITDVVAPNFDAAYQPKTDPAAQVKFGVKDVHDLTWKNLMDAYSCTECGRCTSACPQNMTGKKLSPRKIMMDTRDRLEEVGRNMDKNKGVFVDDGKSLLHDYTTPEEIWACNTCNACVQECPVNIDPLAIIVEMRRHLVMEESAARNELNLMFSNIENNGAPWQFAQSSRADWINQN
jgi:heterodisulfide reductase subunit C